MTPVFGPTNELNFVVASRAHHADIGGLTPGSMPPTSRTIDEEGVLFDGVQIVEQGRFREAEVRRLLGAGRYPARNPDQNVADLKAQLAANARGVVGLSTMTARFGLSVVRAYMRHVQDNAENCVRAALEALERRPVDARSRRRRAHRRQCFSRPRKRVRDHRLRGHVGRERDEFQRAILDRASGGALRVPHVWSARTSR